MARTKRSAHTPSPAEDSLTRAVGANLHRLRAERKWSMDELSARSGVSKAMLHQIELGKSVPTIAVVWRIADGLKVPFSELLSQPQAASDVLLSKSEAKYLTNAAGTFSSRALFPFNGPARTAEFYELRIKPGGTETAAAHAHGTVEHLALVHGTVVVEVDGSSRTLAPGDCLVFAADRPHCYRNPVGGQEALLFLMMTYALAGQVHT
jgi:transcriptional regulator with XRE-family HTH domain